MSLRVIGLIAFGLVVAGAVVAFAAWPLLHPNVGKVVIAHTNTVITNAAAEQTQEVTKKDKETNGKIATVVRRAAQDAGRVRADDSSDPGSYRRWVNGLCANDIYEGYADCPGPGGKLQGGGAKGSGH